MTAVAMTIAGSDPSGGAGIQADLKTFHQHGVYGTSVITLLTVQNTQMVDAVKILEPDFIIAQLDAVLDDIPPGAAKTGALGNAAVIEAIAERASGFAFPLVVDPVMISKHGIPLLAADASELLRRKLLPCAYLVTPNLFEAAALAEFDVDDLASMEKAAAAIGACGAKNVLVKGGHLEERAVDVLWSNGRTVRFSADRIESKNTHGSGCVLSAAITAQLSRGERIEPAIERSKRFVTSAIRTSPGLGAGFGPMNLGVDVADCE